MLPDLSGQTSIGRASTKQTSKIWSSIGYRLLPLKAVSAMLHALSLIAYIQTRMNLVPSGMLIPSFLARSGYVYARHLFQISSAHLFLRLSSPSANPIATVSVFLHGSGTCTST